MVFVTAFAMVGSFLEALQISFATADGLGWVSILEALQISFATADGLGWVSVL